MTLNAREAEVKIHQKQIAGRRVDDITEATAFLLNCPCQIDVFSVGEWPAGECRIAVSADFELNVFAQTVVVTQALTQVSREVAVSASRHAVVDLLQGHDVGALVFTDTRDTLWVKAAIIADRLVDIVCQNRDLHELTPGSMKFSPRPCKRGSIIVCRLCLQRRFTACLNPLFIPAFFHCEPE